MTANWEESIGGTPRRALRQNNTRKDDYRGKKRPLSQVLHLQKKKAVPWNPGGQGKGRGRKKGKSDGEGDPRLHSSQTGKGRKRGKPPPQECLDGQR